MNVTRVSSISDNGIVYFKESKKETIPWDEIYAADAFKRDLLNYDLICLQLRREWEDDGIELDEEDPKWKELMTELPQRMEGFRAWESWFPEVAHPAFATNVTRVFERKIDPNKAVEDNAGQPPPANQANSRRASP